MWLEVLGLDLCLRLFLALGPLFLVPLPPGSREMRATRDWFRRKLVTLGKPFAQSIPPEVRPLQQNRWPADNTNSF